MSDNFDCCEPIEQNECLDRFRQHMEDRIKNGGSADTFEKGICDTLNTAGEALQYYRCILNENGFNNLILPHHAARNSCQTEGQNEEVPAGGKSLRVVVGWYRDSYIPERRFPGSLSKIFGQLERFFCHPENVIRADFLLVSNLRHYSHPGDSHYSPSHDGSNKIFIANGFHRFVAYGLWVDNHGFRPLEVYYVTTASV